MKEAAPLVITLHAAQTHTMRGADGSVIQVAALNSTFDPEIGFDAEMKVRFAEEHTLGQIRPGNSYRVTIEDLGVIAPVAYEVASDPATAHAAAPVAPDQQVQVTTGETPQQVQV